MDIRRPFSLMNHPEFFSGGADDGTGNRPSPRKELQGPRPAALKVNKNAYKIRKPPVAPRPHDLPPVEAPPRPAEDRQPVIIYSVSPKVISTTVSDFMALVQRLTGNTSEGGASTSGARPGPGDLSPAARLASIEKLSPKDRDREIAANNAAVNGNSDFVVDLFEDAEVDLEKTPGILSPAPGTLQPISPGFFSPVPGDPFMMGDNMFIPSPSTFFSAPVASPSPASSCDIFNLFFDF